MREGTAVSTRHFDIIRSVKIIYGNHILLGQGTCCLCVHFVLKATTPIALL